MRWETISGIVDRVILVAVTWLASKGYIASNDVANLVAAVMAILGAIWGFWVNRPANLITAASNLSKVDSIKLNDKAMAESITSDKVK